MWMWIALFLIFAIAFSPVWIEVLLSMCGRASQVIPFMLFYTVPAGAVALVIWMAVAAWRNFL
jgi:hypothetical protein